MTSQTTEHSYSVMNEDKGTRWRLSVWSTSPRSPCGAERDETFKAVINALLGFDENPHADEDVQLELPL